jgi:DNA-binding NarL/FixJ family response regulator
MKPEKTASVLIVDDEFLIQELWALVVEDMGLDVCGRAATADDAIQLARAHRPAVVLMDMRLEGEKDGVDAAVAIRSATDSKVIFVTGSHEEKTISRIRTSQPAAILFKPVSDRQIRLVIEAALRE